MALVLLEVFTDPVLARVAKSKLDAHGIASFLFDEQMGGSVFPSFASFPMRLMVSQDDLEEATAVLNDELAE